MNVKEELGITSGFLRWLCHGRTVKKPVMQPARVEEPAGDEKFGNAPPSIVGSVTNFAETPII
jgi:hypothetical protein